MMRRKLVVAIFLLGFITLSTFVAGQKFFVDDFAYALGEPKLTEGIGEFWQDYSKSLGVYRPVAVGYYYIIYKLYEVSSSLAHLLPWFLHVLGGYLLFLVLVKQGMRSQYSLIAGLWYIFHPFAVEQYGWLSANPGTLVNLIFLLQLLMVYKLRRKEVVLAGVWFLGLVAVFLYESTFFLFIPLVYLILIRWFKSGGRKFRLVGLAGLLAMPTGLYGLTKLLVKGSDSRPLVDSVGLFWAKINEMFTIWFKIHFDEYYKLYFWGNYQKEGLSLILGTPVALVGLLMFLAWGSWVLWSSFKSVKLKRVSKEVFVFWGSALFFSLVPLLLNKEFYYGFRSLFLPEMLVVVLVLWLIEYLGKSNSLKAVSVFGLVLIGYFSLIDVAMLNKYVKRYELDMKWANQIKRVIDEVYPEAGANSVKLYLKSEVPLDSRDSFIHADHLLSCFYYRWSGGDCMKAVTDKVKVMGVEHADGRREVPSEFGFSGIFGQERAINLRLTKSGEVVRD